MADEQHKGHDHQGPARESPGAGPRVPLERPSEKAMREVKDDPKGVKMEVDKGTYVDHAALDAALKPVREGHELLVADFLRLTQALKTMNHYQQRIPEVSEVCDAILQPDPTLAKANEALAEARACKRRVGKVTAVTADWDADWQYLFTWRGSTGFSTMPGFDLRPDTAGLSALKEALVAHGIPLKDCALDPPSLRDGRGMARRIIWQAAA